MTTPPLTAIRKTSKSLAPLCAPCKDERARWLDYRLPRTFGIAYGSGTPYDVSPAGLRGCQRGRYETWRETIKFNRDLIARTCRQHRHVDQSRPTVASVVVVQLPLFDLLEAA